MQVSMEFQPQLNLAVTYKQPNLVSIYHWSKYYKISFLRFTFLVILLLSAVSGNTITLEKPNNLDNPR